jgi:uncharacterized protein GlcG (DUF336 family)
MFKRIFVLSLAFDATTGPAIANGNACNSLPNFSALRQALDESVHTTNPKVSNGGLEFNMWATIVDRDGVVCAVTFTGEGRGDQWPGSRVISAQKANTANDFSLDDFALSTANLYSATQPGGSLYGLQHSNPVDTGVAYGGPSNQIGTPQDPMVGKKIGGVNVFGGGLALYSGGKVIGAVGVSGDTSCADHNVAWRVREALGLDSVPHGVGGGKDRIIYDVDSTIQTGGPIVDYHSKSGFGHPKCGGTEDQVAVAIGAGVIPP